MPRYRRTTAAACERKHELTRAGFRVRMRRRTGSLPVIAASAQPVTAARTNSVPSGVVGKVKPLVRIDRRRSGCVVLLESGDEPHLECVSQPFEHPDRGCAASGLES